MVVKHVVRPSVDEPPASLAIIGYGIELIKTAWANLDGEMTSGAGLSEYIVGVCSLKNTVCQSGQATETVLPLERGRTAGLERKTRIDGF